MIPLNKCNKPIEIGDHVLYGEIEGIVIDFSGTQPGIIYIRTTITGQILPVDKDFCTTLK